MAIQALVIGNGAYPIGLTLTSPTKDAEAVKDALTDLKIEVTDLIDEPYLTALAIINRFIDKVNLPTTAVSILYYSGHGVQLEETNYIVPIDFQDSTNKDISRLISVQSILDRMTSATAIRIVLLDACRTHEDATLVVGRKHIIISEVDKAVFLNGVEIPPPGLAEMKATGNTFIAFAAGPGEVALEGIAGSVLSPFTRALVKHLSSVDLPISNLTARVRQEVLEETGGRQRTWDQSSLIVPFYFSPGSILLFTGNIVALGAFIMSVLIYSLVLSSPSLSAEWVGAALVPPVASFTILIAGAQGAYSRLRGTTSGAGERASFQQAFASLRKGVIGGFLGSLIGSPFISLNYYYFLAGPTETFGQLCLEVTYAAAPTGCCLGALSLSGAHLFSKLRSASSLPNGSTLRMVFGSALGGLVAGLIAGPAIGWHFGQMDERELIPPHLLIPGALVGAAALVFAIVNFDLERLNRRRIRTSALASMLALVLGIPSALIVFGPLYLLGLIDKINYLLEQYEDACDLLAAGAYYGVPVGLVLGLVIGVAIVVTQAWSGKPVLT